jgi:hypothetical protein
MSRHSARHATSTGCRLSRLAGATVAAAAAAGGLLAAAAPAAHAQPPSPVRQPASVAYTFTTLDDQADPTFNQLLGINTHNVISGYFGSGAPVHPNKGYLLDPPYGQGNYVNENFLGSAQTQVTGLNNKGDTVGFYVNAKGTNRGFVEWNGVFQSYVDPHTPRMPGSVNQLLGINDGGIAVGFYTNAQGNNVPIMVNQATSAFTTIHVGGAVSATATGINDTGDIVGFFTDAGGVTASWLLHAGHLTTFQFPGGSDTQALGLNSHDEIVGSYLDDSAVMHGFALTDPFGPVSHWTTIDDPNGVGSTVVNGLNNAGDLVGFYTDAAGNTDGMLATP